MPATFTTKRRVEFAETDAAGIVHFANFYRWMEEAEHEYFRSLGLSIMHQEEDGSLTSWPRVAADCTFEAPARFEDEIEVRLDVSHMGSRSLTIGVEFLLAGKRLAYGNLKTVCCRIVHGEKMRSIEIPRRYRDKIVVKSPEA